MDKGHQVHRDAFERVALVEPRQRQQIFDKSGHPAALLSDPAHSLLQRLPFSQLALAPEVGKSLDGGHRGAQLMRGVSHELAESILEALLLVEHDVEGPGQMRGLGPRRGFRHST